MKYIMLSICSLFLSCDFKSAQDYFDDATKLEEQNKYQEAVAQLDMAIDKDPKFIGALINRGADKSALGRYAEAIADYEMVLSIDKHNTMALYNLGLNQENQKDYNSAIKYYNEALDTKGGQFLTMDWVDNQNFPNERAAYDVYTFDIIYARALCYYQLDSLRNAGRDLKSCIRNNYNKPESYFYLSQIYATADLVAEACKYLDTAIQLGYKDYLPEQVEFYNKK